ncbi:MAG TPA: 4-(cytidine 5'-diphospho)-2-C-methyl-D-erythritol kinase [Gemmatimonadales bacterium]|nr:4-(cytidine 5'-diphospho)-2-C-methyl-D-erythritol kinase [Gemmatimonadales bacterium]
MSERVILQACAKVNLFLRVLARDADGYHSLETLFCRLALADTLTARRGTGRGVRLTVSGADCGPEADNLAFRAVEALLRVVREPFAVELTLEKRIPVGAGLGGGSADAAAALLAVNQLAGQGVPRAELLHLAAGLGADIPFCASGASLALAWGRGERLLALPALPPAPVLLLSPAVPVRTADAYAWLDQASRGARRGALALEPAALAAWSDVARMAGNDFESVVFGRLPAVREAFEALARTGPLLCRMTGSGSTLVAVYRSERERDDARMALGKKHGTLIATRTG